MRIRTNAKRGAVYGTLKVMGICQTIATKSKTPGRSHYRVDLECLCICGVLVTRDKKRLEEGVKTHCGKVDCMRVRARTHWKD